MQACIGCTKPDPAPPLSTFQQALAPSPADLNTSRPRSEALGRLGGDPLPRQLGESLRCPSDEDTGGGEE